MFRTRLTLRPGRPGTKRLVTQYGDELVCVRYRYDDTLNRRLKTIELVVEDVPWFGQRSLDRPVDSAYDFDRRLDAEIDARADSAIA